DLSVPSYPLRPDPVTFSLLAHQALARLHPCLAAEGYLDLVPQEIASLVNAGKRSGQARRRPR
ncbi:unnamed protein product, partial [Urochloa humidicola]